VERDEEQQIGGMKAKQRSKEGRREREKPCTRVGRKNKRI